MASTLDNGAKNKPTDADLIRIARESGLEAQQEQESLARAQRITNPRVTPEGDEVFLDAPQADAKIADNTTTVTDRAQPEGIIPGDIFEDNILSKYGNSTYNFRLFMTSEAVTHESLAFSDSIIIAETGSTGFNITDVQMDTIISPSQSTRNTFATSVVIKIIEPFGTSLLDFIRNAAASVGVFAHQNAPLWLDLRFKGYIDGFDESFQGGEFADLSDQTRTWKLRVIKVDIEMNSGGTEYTMHLVAQDEAALEDSARLLEEKIKIKATTVGEFIDQLTKLLNKYADYKINNVILDDEIKSLREYVFALPGDPIVIPNSSPKQENERRAIKRESLKAVDEPMRNWKIRGKTRDKSVKTETFVQEKDKTGNFIEKWEITFEKSTPIETIIQQVIASTEEGQSLLIFGEPNKKIAQNAKDRNPTLPSIAFVIDPTIEFISYNNIAKAYNTKITYNIRLYKTYIPVVTREHIEAAQSAKASKERIKAMIEVSDVKKIYNYMFTGENTEVLDYKVELNSTWFISLPLFRGQARTMTAISGRNIIDGESQQIDQNKSPKSLADSVRDLRNEISQLRDDIDDAADDQLATAQANLAVAQNQLNELEGRVAEQVQQPLRAGQNVIDTSSFGLASRRITLANDARAPGTATQNNRTAPVKNLNSSGSIFFAEDIDIFGDDETTNRQTDQNEQITNIGAQVSPSTAATGQNNVEGVRDENRSFFAAAINQVYGFKGQLIKLDMEIRGDPYWLGEPNSFKRLTNVAGFPDHTKADSLIILTFKFPVSLDDGGNENRDQSYTGTGLYTLKRQENGFNGVYRIFKVENSFSGGRFTQRLTGAIDPLTKEQDLISELEKSGN